ncbi:MAG TPA: methyltransferase domain-containing protein [Rhizomicrobium sp.]|jgi:phosphatidylethanolamine/phosphatidyl-N-methylethanolamine N-methyltransferase|nr:methyltransferase domain-containing protein [Rhizomicrobium sp.]
MTRETATLSDQWRFLRGLIERPKNVGAIAPSSPQLARAIAAQIDPAVDGPVLELGPGTGVITDALIKRGIAPERITAIEYDPDFASMVRTRFPRVNVIQGDAFDLVHTLGRDHDTQFAAVVSGLPLLNFPPHKRAALIEGALSRLKPGCPFVQFSYGLNAPAIPPKDFTITRAALVWRNLPPARVWVYRRT